MVTLPVAALISFCQEADLMKLMVRKNKFG